MIKIKALDTLFFRDNKPFTLGQESNADSVFPPLPSVFYGALRSAYLARNQCDFQVLDGEKDKSKHLQILGIYYAHSSYDDILNIYLPIPLDLVVPKDKDNKTKAKLLKINKLGNVITNTQTEFVLTSDENIEHVSKGILHQFVFEKYLKGDYDEFSYESLNNLITYEPKIGIARDNSKTSKDGMIYRINLIRPKNLSFVVDYKGIELEHEGFLKLGGQHRPSYYKKINNCINFRKNYLHNGDKYFKLYLLTPGLFSNGWLLGSIDESTMILEHGNVKAKLITAAVGKPIYVSGFDLKLKRPKPMYKVVPEGSVYYFELLEGTIEDVYNNFHLKSICDINDEYVNRGYGITLVGRVTK